MSLDVTKYEKQIRAILQAPGVDLSTISAKRVRKQLLEQNADLTPDLVKAYKEDLDALIGNVYEQVSGGVAEGDAVEEPPKRKYEAEDHHVAPTPKKPKKEAKRDPELSDAEYARQLQQELNSRDTRAAASGKAKPAAKRGRKAKSAATVDSDGEGGDDGDGVAKPKRKGGFTKEYTLSDPLRALLQVEKLSRPQVVKQLWDHIKLNKLQNPDDRREIICDQSMKDIFGVDRIGMFKMNKQLGEHLFEPGA